MNLIRILIAGVLLVYGLFFIAMGIPNFDSTGREQAWQHNRQIDNALRTTAHYVRSFQLEHTRWPTWEEFEAWRVAASLEPKDEDERIQFHHDYIPQEVTIDSRIID
jgi:hypothetical protein